jgi:hypothetical protein
MLNCGYDVISVVFPECEISPMRELPGRRVDMETQSRWSRVAIATHASPLNLVWPGGGCAGLSDADDRTNDVESWRMATDENAIDEQLVLQR